MAQYLTTPVPHSLGKGLTNAFVDLYFMNYIEAMAASAMPHEQQYPKYPICTDANILSLPMICDLPNLKSFIRILVVTFKLPRVILIASLVYLGRWRHRHPNTFGVSPCAPHRLVLTSMIIAAKHLYDDPPRNCDWVRFLKNKDIRHFSVTKINSMEEEMLLDLRWEIQIYPADVRRVSEPVLHILDKELRDYALDY